MINQLTILFNRCFFTGTLLIFLIASLAACGGGGGGGGDEIQDTPVALATIDSNNAQKLATAATEGVIQAYEVYILNSIADSELGNASICTTGSTANDYDAVAGSGSISFIQCEFLSLVFDGTGVMSASRSGDVVTIATAYNGLMVNSTPTDIDVSCAVNTVTSDVNCVYSAVSLGMDNRSYSVSDATLSGTLLGGGYTISATVIDPEHGSISISTESPVSILVCTEGQPSSGEIQFTDGDSKVVSVTYDSCNSYTVSYSGVSNTYNWE